MHKLIDSQDYIKAKANAIELYKLDTTKKLSYSETISINTGTAVCPETNGTYPITNIYNVTFHFDSNQNDFSISGVEIKRIK